MKKLIRLIVGMLAAFGALIIILFAGIFLLEKFTSSSTSDTRSVQVIAGNKLYSVPRNYFILPYSKSDKIESEHLSIRSYYPDMLGATKDTIKYEKINHGWNDRILIRVSEIKAVIKNGMYNFYRNYVENNSLYDYTYKGNRYGLHYYQIKPRPGSSGNKDIYVDDIDKPELYIMCHTEMEEKLAPSSPSCHLVFILDGMRYEIHFSRAHIVNWVDIREKVILLVSRLQIQ